MQARTNTFNQNSRVRPTNNYTDDMYNERPETDDQIDLSQVSMQQVFKAICPLKITVFFFMLSVLFYLHKIAYK